MDPLTYVERAARSPSALRWWRCWGDLPTRERSRLAVPGAVIPAVGLMPVGSRKQALPRGILACWGIAGLFCAKGAEAEEAAAGLRQDQ